MSRVLNNLAVHLSERYSRTETVDDLEEAIRVGREAITKAINDVPDRAQLLSSLGARLVSRFKRNGVMSDVDEAIEVQEKVSKRFRKEIQLNSNS